MAARNFATPRSLQRELILVSGSFAPNGTSAVSATSRTGPGWSVARTGVGVFVVTLSDKYKNLLAANATLQLAVAADSDVQIGPVDLSAKTIGINVLTAGSAADLAADAGTRINFCFFLSNTSISPVRG